MDAMGLSNKKSHTVSTSHSGSFTHNPAESPKTPGIVSSNFGSPDTFQIYILKTQYILNSNEFEFP